MYLATGFLARALGDTAGVSAAVRAARDAGAPRGVEVLDLMRELDGALMSRRVAWFAAGRGDRPAAVAALQRGATDPLIRLPGSMQDADQTCSSTEVYGLLGDAEAMLPFLRRCLTMSNGYHLPWLGEPAFARFRADSPVRALAVELVAAQARARSTTVGAAP